MQRRVFELKDLRDQKQRDELYEKIDRLAGSDAFDACEITLKLQVIHEPARSAREDHPVEEYERPGGGPP